jgi:hypothetical protein
MALTQINGEPVRLVKAFEELREGMIIYTGRCPDHGVFHRAMLIDKRKQFVTAGLIDKKSGAMIAFGMIPAPHREGDVITPGFVAAGQVYLLIDDDLTEVSRQVTRSRQKERTR